MPGQKNQLVECNTGKGFAFFMKVLSVHFSFGVYDGCVTLQSSPVFQTHLPEEVTT